MSKRHERALAEIAVLQAAAIEPCRGMSVIGFVDRQDIGSGFRPFHVLAVGKKWITLYYVPTLKQFKVHAKEWAIMRPTEYQPSHAYNVGYMNAHMAQFDTLGIQYSKLAANAALDLFKGKLADAALAALNRGEHAIVTADANGDSSVLREVDTKRRHREHGLLCGCVICRAVSPQHAAKRSASRKGGALRKTTTRKRPTSHKGA